MGLGLEKAKVCRRTAWLHGELWQGRLWNAEQGLNRRKGESQSQGYLMITPPDTQCHTTKTHREEQRGNEKNRLESEPDHRPTLRDRKIKKNQGEE